MPEATFRDELPLPVGSIEELFHIVRVAVVVESLRSLFMDVCVGGVFLIVDFALASVVDAAAVVGVALVRSSRYISACGQGSKDVACGELDARDW